MAVYQCVRCMKKFVDDRNMKLLCPFCRCRLLPYRGYPPLNPCKTALMPTHSPASPLPLPAQLSFHLKPIRIPAGANIVNRGRGKGRVEQGRAEVMPVSFAPPPFRISSATFNAGLPRGK
jgi:hypothetical protein